MRIILIAGGSRGDVQPYVALGQGLRAAGHSVGLLAQADFQELVTSHGLEFFEIGGSAQAAAQSQMQGLWRKATCSKSWPPPGAAPSKWPTSPPWPGWPPPRALT